MLDKICRISNQTRRPTWQAFDTIDFKPLPVIPGDLSFSLNNPSLFGLRIGCKFRQSASWSNVDIIKAHSAKM